MNCSKVCILLVANLLLGACASQSSKAIAKLDSGSPEFSSAPCQNARHNAWLYDEVQKNKLWAGPSVILLAGPIAVLPVLVTNIGLNSADHISANDISGQCGGQVLSQKTLNQNIAMDATLSVAVGGIAPALAPRVTAP
jgi:hypothetical protein